MIFSKKICIGILGLGYIGLPLAIEFSKKFKVIGYDIDSERITELFNGKDKTKEVRSKELIKANKLFFTSNYKDLSLCNIFIITVPTPISHKNEPNLKPLIRASKTIANILKKDNIVIYESTLFPGAVEEVCVPILEKQSGLVFNKDFFCGYSPERINPGDKSHQLVNIKKITSGSTKKIATFIDNLYKKIIKAGTHKVSSIKVAEAAKVIENCQRDLNIAFINELSVIFDKLNLDTSEILKAASTKWNFLNFKPGLVGGHCIGVDPYYLTYKANQKGYNPKVILSGRDVNSDMGFFVVKKLINKMKKNNIKLKLAKILIMGFSFKENCQDIRNTRVIDIVHSLKRRNCLVDVYDPLVNKRECLKNYKVRLIDYPKYSKYDSIILAVSHSKFKKIGISKIRKFGKKNSIIFDIKSFFNKKYTNLTL